MKKKIYSPKRILNHFKKVDPIIYKTALKLRLDERIQKTPEKFFKELCSAIIDQQLSGKVADVIEGRFVKLFKKGLPTPEGILKLDDEAIRAVGTSYAKVRSLKDLAQKVKGKEIHLDKLQDMNDDEVIADLIRVKGIGPWTAEMFLMFTLNREDVFSHGDLGLKNGIKKLYSLENPTKEQVEEIVSKWSPYKTYASRLLWKSLEV